MSGERCPTLVQLIKMTALNLGFPGGSDSKESACNAGDLDLIPGSGRSLGEENGYPLQYSCLENSKGREAWGPFPTLMIENGNNWKSVRISVLSKRIILLAWVLG